MILVTGGTGLVGSHLLYKLSLEGHKLRAIYRKIEQLEKVKTVFGYYSSTPDILFDTIEWIKADLNDVPILAEVFTDINYVYHCAAFISFESNSYHKLRKTNIEGTANIVNLCIANEVKKLCYVSSIAALGRPSKIGDPVDEDSLWNSESDNSIYAITKYGAEIEVWRGTQEGVDAVIVNPGIIIGPGFWDGEGSSSLIARVDQGIPYYTNGSTGYVDVIDVVNIMQQLMMSDQRNERFLLVAETWSYKKFLDKVSSFLGVKSPSKVASTWLLSIGWRVDWLLYHIKLQSHRKLTKRIAQTLRTDNTYDATKITSVLNYKFKPLDQTLKENCALYLESIHQAHRQKG